MHNNQPRTTYAFLEDPYKRRAADFLILKIGIRAKYIGTLLLTDAILVYACTKFIDFGRIYKTVASYRGKRFKTVFRSIAYAVKNSNGLCANLAAVFGSAPTDPKPSNVISMLGEYLKCMLSVGGSLCRCDKQSLPFSRL